MKQKLSTCDCGRVATGYFHGQPCCDLCREIERIEIEIIETMTCGVKGRLSKYAKSPGEMAVGSHGINAECGQIVPPTRPEDWEYE